MDRIKILPRITKFSFPFLLPSPAAVVMTVTVHDDGTGRESKKKRKWRNRVQGGAAKRFRMGERTAGAIMRDGVWVFFGEREYEYVVAKR